MDDEDDYDAEKVLCDIKNFQKEKFFNIYYNHSNVLKDLEEKDEEI